MAELTDTTDIREAVEGADLSLICVDDVDLLRYGNPPVTVISRQFERIGELAANRLLERIRTPEATEHQQIFVPTNLVIRASTSATH